MNENREPNAGSTVPPPLIYLGALIVGLVLNARLPTPLIPRPARMVGGVLIALGMILGGSAFTAMQRAGTSPDPDAPTSFIVTEGPFRFTRNPIYLSFALIYAGLALAFRSMWALVLLPFVLVGIERGQIAREERYLERRFGDEYLRYKSRVRRWI